MDINDTNHNNSNDTDIKNGLDSSQMFFAGILVVLAAFGIGAWKHCSDSQLPSQEFESQIQLSDVIFSHLRLDLFDQHHGGLDCG